MKKQSFFFISILFFGLKLISQVPILNSNPLISNKVIYLDFDGQVVSGTMWNNGNTVNAAASTASSANIKIIWQRVSEDYRPFDVNITTDSVRFKNASPSSRIRVIFTGTSSWFGSAGGVAYVGSFTWGGYPGTPCWVFENQLNYNAKSMAEAAAHEVGHTLSLYHQSTYNSACTKTNEYNPGTGNGVTSWAPIMGVGYSKNVTIWHNGTNANGCNIYQFDHSNGSPGITGNTFLNFLPDDVGDAFATAKLLNLTGTSLSDSGLITTPGDVDIFRFEICNSRYISINAKPWALDTNANSYSGANLDIKLKLYNSSGTMIMSDTSYSKLNSLIGGTLNPGVYYFGIDGGASANYSDYGSLGKYFFSIKALNPPQLANSIVTPSNICVGQIASLSYSSNGTPANWLWTVNGPSSGTYSVQNPNFSFNTAGIYTIALLATSSTSASCVVTKTIQIGTNPSITVSGASSLLCLPSAATLIASGAGSYTWLPGNFSGSSLAVSPTVNTTYTVNGNNGSCYNAAIVNVTIGPTVTLSLTTTNSVLCMGNSATITASGASSYVFNPGNISATSIVVTPTFNTNYSVTASNGICSKTGYALILVEQPYSITVTSSDIFVCPGQSLTISASGAANFTFNPGGLTGANVVVAPLITTNYTVLASSVNNCPADTTILITTIPCNMTGLTAYAAEQTFKLFPNPAKEILNISSGSGIKDIEITDVNGKLIFEKHYIVAVTEISVNTSLWNKGVYFIRVLGDSLPARRKIMIE